MSLYTNFKASVEWAIEPNKIAHKQRIKVKWLIYSHESEAVYDRIDLFSKYFPTIDTDINHFVGISIQINIYIHIHIVIVIK